MPTWLSVILGFLVASGVLTGGLVVCFKIWIVPWLKKGSDAAEGTAERATYEKRWARAQEIAFLADRLTDLAVVNFPSTSIDDYVDKLVDDLIKAAGLTDWSDSGKTAAKREVTAQLLRKLPEEKRRGLKL